METLRYAMQRLRASLFVLPTTVVGVCIVAAVIALRIDTVGSLRDLPVLVSASLAGGRSIATAVAGATITVAAIVFSMTALSSQIAASQYSPRSVAGFFEDRFQQLVIGLTVGTFAYSLIVLTGLAGIAEADGGLRRSLSVTLAVTLGIASGIAIVAYIDHSLRKMRVGSVVRRIAESTAAAVRRQYHGEGGAGEAAETRMEHGPEATRVWAERMGWVRTIDAVHLARAVAPGTLVRVEVRVGEFVAAGDLLATVWTSDGADPARTRRAVHHAVFLGRERSAATDPGFGIRQMVDIALRALSPGINDPTTAVEVLHHLKVPLRGILTSDAPARVFPGPGRQRVFVPEAPSRSDRVHSAFAEIRMAATGQPAVLRALIEVSADLVSELRGHDLGSRATAVLEEGRLAATAAREAGFPERDLEWIMKASARLELTDEDGAAG